MTINRTVSIFAGFMIMLSLALAHYSGQIDLSRLSWLWFTALVGANLFRTGFTGFCPAAKIFKALGLKDSGGSACAG